MATSMNATQCPKQYPHEKSPPRKGLLLFIQLRNGSNNFVSETVKEMHATTTDKRVTCVMSVRYYKLASAAGRTAGYRAEHEFFNPGIDNFFHF